MKREKEFKDYLIKNATLAQIKDYPTHCRGVEKSMGCDIDDIIVDYKKISEVAEALRLNGKPSGYTAGFNYYLKFAFEQGMLAKSVTYPIEIDSFAGPIVQYYHNVPVVERDESLRRALECEYPKILQFAKSIFDVDYGYIPVYLSKKKPFSKYKLTKRFLEELNERRQEQREMSDKERRLIDDILKNGCYKFDIVAAFFHGERPYIEMYYKNFPAKYRMEEVVNYIAHEYMHFMEYAYCFKNSAPIFVDVKVGEALADFFGVLYSINRATPYDISVAEDRHTLWKVLQGSGWPYAFALHFYTVKGVYHDFSPDFIDYQVWDSIWKLVEVFNATKNSADAYDKLKKL